MARTYRVVGGSGDTRLGASRVGGLPFWIVTDDGISIPIAIRSYRNTLGGPASTGNTLYHVEGELHQLADPSVQNDWSGRHSLELTFDPTGKLIGDTGQV